eukprot:TRINITY_DN1109_c0_g1_i1.p1 TRINITY_DN1109_c0_g1~~TRINITY_DN1109_c0_g1_i1.p1  ORF type:complete len:629 (+),score=144.99 TRINITY_DN1109_c0_g1_i1:341-2227(+)
MDIVTPIRQLKSHLVTKFVTIRGTVVRVGNLKPMVSQMNFRCSRCDIVMSCFFEDGKFKNPEKCVGNNCRSKVFEPIFSSAVTSDWQRLRLQELLDKKDPGRVPRTVEVELLDDLVNSCVPGDVITVNGIVKAQTIEQERGRPKDRNKALFHIYLDANSVENSSKNVDSGKLDHLNFHQNELFAISMISVQTDIFRLIVNSLCPGIYGHEIVKAGLALCVFGGCEKNENREKGMPTRGNPHILIVGDPGLGKSQMLTALNHIAPRGVYVCGSYSSTTGLTVTLLKEPGSGDWSLEAGALVLGDHGCCCIDEFDKMANEHEALLEAMEQQSVSIAKAGIVCNLPARTTVIAAANPVGGHYNRAKTVCENLKMNPALLSRFDLIFILLDKPDAERDHFLSEHVMAIHGFHAENPSKASQNSQSNHSSHTDGKKDSIVHRLKLPRGTEGFEPIHPLLLRKYIAYAKKHIHPKLTPGACRAIQDFYLVLRDKHRSADGTPITTRQLESLIRLAEARAKLELREQVTEEDAKDVIEIMKESLFDRFEDEKGNLDFRRASGMSKTKDANRFIAQLQMMAESNSNAVFSFQQLQQAAQKLNLNIANFEDFIENLNTQNYLLKRPGRTYKLMTSSY